MEYAATYHKYKKGILISTGALAMFGLLIGTTTAGEGGSFAVFCIILFALLGFIVSYVIAFIIFMIRQTPEEKNYFSDIRQRKKEEAMKKLEEARRTKQEKIEAKKQVELQKETERENLLSGYRTMNLASVAQKIPEVNLKKQEYAYYAYNDNDITWSEERTKTSRINYGGLTGSIHIAKGLNYRLGSIKTDIQHETYLKEIFRGALLLTNKRIILGNNDGVKAYPFTRLLRVVPYNDAVVLCSESGKKVILQGFTDAEPFEIILDRLLTEDDVLPDE